MIVSQSLLAVELQRNTEILDPISLNISANIYPKQECEISANIKNIGELKSGEENIREYPINIICTGFGTYELYIGKPTVIDSKVSAEIRSLSKIKALDSDKCGTGNNIFNENSNCIFYGNSNGEVSTIVLELKITTPNVSEPKSLDFNIPISMKTKI